MSQRFFCESPITSGHATLTEAEAHHLIRVMRCKQGDSVILFDGLGREFHGRVEEVGKDQVDIRIEGVIDVNRELPFEFTVAVAFPKGDRQQTLIEKLVELGATYCVPLLTQRGVAQPTANAIARWRRYVIEASKQCGRNRLMKIESPVDCSSLFAQNHQGLKFIAHTDPSMVPLPTTIHQATICAIGPEGGFTENEIQQALTNLWQPISLGPRILRSETAAMAIVSLVGQAMQTRI
jgi:16S rRNA (uracil1498-N3)-methyltransferase